MLYDVAVFTLIFVCQYSDIVLYLKAAHLGRIFKQAGTALLTVSGLTLVQLETGLYLWT